VAHIPKKQEKAQVVVDIEGALRRIHVEVFLELEFLPANKSRIPKTSG
jgi:hypothetical protein